MPLIPRTQVTVRAVYVNVYNTLDSFELWCFNRCQYKWYKCKKCLQLRKLLLNILQSFELPHVISQLSESSRPESFQEILGQSQHRGTRKRCKIGSKLTIKTPEWRQWRRSNVFIINFEQISHLFQCSYCCLWTNRR